MRLESEESSTHGNGSAEGAAGLESTGSAGVERVAGGGGSRGANSAGGGGAEGGLGVGDGGVGDGAVGRVGRVAGEAAADGRGGGNRSRAGGRAGLALSDNRGVDGLGDSAAAGAVGDGQSGGLSHGVANTLVREGFLVDEGQRRTHVLPLWVSSVATGQKVV